MADGDSRVERADGVPIKNMLTPMRKPSACSSVPSGSRTSASPTAARPWSFAQSRTRRISDPLTLEEAVEWRNGAPAPA